MAALATMSSRSAGGEIFLGRGEHKCLQSRINGVQTSMVRTAILMCEYEGVKRVMLSNTRPPASNVRQAAKDRRAINHRRSTAPTPTIARMLTSNEVCEILGITGTTLSRWRSAGRGPPFKRDGGLIRYTAAAIQQWIDGK